MNLQELIDALQEQYERQLAEWEAYQAEQAKLPEAERNPYRIAKPEPYVPFVGNERSWSMRNVVTGSRRKWKR